MNVLRSIPMLSWSFAAILSCGAAAPPAIAEPAAHAVPDTIAQRVQACTACHGKEGLATPQGYFPRIAGKPAGYLFNQLQNFREGRRANSAMRGLLENLSDPYLMEIAGYFAALDLPYAPPAVNAASKEELARGRLLVETGDASRQLPACVRCHGPTLTGVSPSTPAVIGMHRDYLLAQFGAWRSGERRAAAPDCMADISRRLSLQDIGAVAGYLSQQAVPAGATPAASVPLPLPIACGSGPK